MCLKIIYDCCFQSVVIKLENMTEFSEAILEKKLTELRDSQKEIQSLSQYCVQHRQHCKLIVKVETSLVLHSNGSGSVEIPD